MRDEDLVRKVKESINDGYELSDIKQALLGDGYDRSRVERIFRKVKEDISESEDNSRVIDSSSEEFKSNIEAEEPKNNGIKEDNEVKDSKSGDSRPESQRPSYRSAAWAAIKAGIPSGIVYGLSTAGLIIVFGSQVGGILGMITMMSGLLVAVMTITFGLITFSVGGIFMGPLFAGLYPYLPGSGKEKKGIIFGFILGLMGSLSNLSYGLGMTNIVVSALNLVSVVLWGYLTAKLIKF